LIFIASLNPVWKTGLRECPRSSDEADFTLQLHGEAGIHQHAMKIHAMGRQLLERGGQGLPEGDTILPSLFVGVPQLLQAVIRECGFPLAAPSANPSNAVSPTNAGHVCKSLGGRVRLIVDGGQSQIGIESTVLDLTGRQPIMLREGAISADELEKVIGQRPVAKEF